MGVGVWEPPSFFIYKTNGGGFPPSPFLHPRAGGFWVLGCSDPSLVRSVAFCMLAPASCRARDHALLRCAARIPLPYNSRLPMRFTPRKKPIVLQGSCLQLSKCPKYTYTLYTWYLFLICCVYSYTPEYTPIPCLFYPIKYSLPCQEQSHATLRTWLRNSPCPLYTTALVTHDP